MDTQEPSIPIKGCKYDNDKPRWDLLPLEEIADVVDVYTAGANKYGPNNWQKVEDGYNRYKAALFRHLLEYERGREYDDETGCKHLAQVVWNAIAMLYFSKHYEGKDMWDFISAVYEPVGDKDVVQFDHKNNE